MNHEVFISYRRASGHELAHLVYGELRGRGHTVYIDVTTSGPGQIWEQLQAAIRACRVFVLICSPGCFDGLTPDDWLIREIAAALEHGRQIVPVWANAFTPPSEVAEVARKALDFQGVIMHAQYMEAAFERLAKLVAASESVEAALKRHEMTGVLEAYDLFAAFQIAEARALRFARVPSPTVPPDSRKRGRLQELLGIQSGSEVALLPNSQNVAVGAALGGWNPSNLTLKAAGDVGHLLSEFGVSNIVAEPIHYRAASHHLCAFGFETSQPLYRQIAGYRELDWKTRSEEEGYERHPIPGPFTLPWTSNLGSEADLNDPEQFFQTTIEQTKEQKRRRIWSLHNGGNVIRPLFQDGRCSLDYVSIVHVPSYFAQAKNHTLTLFGGIQAAGTSALDALVRNSEVLDWIQRKAPGASAWQAIVQVDVRGREPVFQPVSVDRVAVDEAIFKRWQASPPTF